MADEHTPTTDDDPVSCGWKRAVADVRRVLDA